jgi:3',5'-cyclic AMP phosphodiesterase CpdA
MIILNLFISCGYVDIGGIFYSSYINDRFREKADLKAFPTPDVSDDNNFSFLIITDLHYYDKQPHYFEEINDHTSDWKYSFVVIMGDIAQNGYQSAFNLAKKDISTSIKPVLPIPGNHDIYNNGWPIYKKEFGRSVYAFHIGESYFIFLDTCNGTLGSLQKAWLEARLKNSRAYKNVFVFSHYNITESEAQSGTEWTSHEERYYLINLLAKYDVDYFFSGHLHLTDIKELQGVRHIVLKNLNADSKKGAYLKITVNGSSISERFY